MIDEMASLDKMRLGISWSSRLEGNPLEEWVFKKKMNAEGKVEKYKS